MRSGAAFWAIALLLAGFAAPARAANSAAEDVKAWFSEAQFLIDNDTWAKTDRYYTNGFKFGGAAHLGGIFRLPAAAALRITRPTEEPDAFGGVFVGQNMYTPKLISVVEPQPFDRPWAAWLYIGTLLQVVQPNGKVLDSVEFDIGMVGPAALGEEIQTKVHELVGASKPRGWHNQLPNEPGFLLAYLHKRKYGTSDVDVIPHAGLTLGTVLTLARAGGTVRLGRNLSGFGPDRIEPGGALLQNTRAHLDKAGRPSWEYYVFAGADLRFVAYNIFLDGTVFRDSPSVERRPYVHDLSFGVSMRYRAFRMTLSHVQRSEEFSTALGGGGKQSFYALSLAYEPAPPSPPQPKAAPNP